MPAVTHPAELNPRFAALYNARDLAGLLSLYEQDAAHHNAQTAATDHGLAAIEASLRALLALGGTMTSVNNFCVVSGELALLRADWTVRAADGGVVAQGSSAEIARRQDDGGWKSVIDHAVGASLARVD